MKKAVILDTSAIIYRSHFALMGMKNSQGLPTGATFGFINTLENVIKEFSPDYLVACLDVKRDELERSDELETYKANRESMPEEIVAQLNIIMEVLDGYNIPKYKKKGQEADDVIATFATNFSKDEEPIQTFIITGDKDLTQLVNEKINIALLGKGNGKDSNFKYIRNDDDVIDYLGVSPDKIPDLFGLMGDKSDGIPGVTGIGPKNGVKLITTYQNLENLYKNIDDLKGKQKENLINDKEKAFLSRELATVKRELEIEYDKNKLKFENKNFEKLFEIYKKMEFKRFSENLEEERKRVLNQNLKNSDEISEEDRKMQLKLQKEIEEMEEKKKRILEEEAEYDKENPIFNGISNFYSNKNNSEKLDTLNILEIKKEIFQKNKNNKNIDYKIANWNNAHEIIKEMENKIAIFENIFGLSIFDGNENVILLNSDLEKALNAEKTVQNNLFDKIESCDNKNISKIYEELNKKEIIAYNIKEYMKKHSNYFDAIISGKNYSFSPLRNENKNTEIDYTIKSKNYFDVMIASYVLETEGENEIENIIKNELEVEISSFETEFQKERRKRNFDGLSDKIKAEFLAIRGFYIYNLEKILKVELKNNGLLEVYENLESKLIPVLAQMEENGIKIDKNYFKNFENELNEKINKLILNIHKIADDEEFNIDSSQQLGEILFEKMQIPVVKKTKTRYSTDVEVLEKIADDNELSDEKREIAKNLLEYRAFKKLLSTYIEPIPQYADKDDRIHTTFNQNGTATGRLSSANPNLQNIPARTDDGMRIRTGFVAQDGYSLISFDYSQIELRVLAELSKDKTLIFAYKEDKDLHDLTARKIFLKNDDEKVSREERSIAKVINFSILYGKTNFGLSKELNISVGDAAQYIKTYFEEYPRVQKFLNIVTETAKLHNFVETFYGTRRYIKGIDSQNKNTLAQAIRMAVNTVVQGTAANVIKIVMIKLHEELKNDENIKMLLQVHDELIFEVKDGFEEIYMKKIKDIMENTVKFEKVPLKANGNIAKNWGLLK
ncbi:DNA polymerase I [Leptotrichia sp. oral taxon 218]|uniref:DNA polymerase I n=1 Tax=Leptotrichia sp. oral taxon 218 TaxID=712361 RepID=UPI001B8C6D27|nr:DNA polymerase I [Leptotrichia sp. oral taxon 218]QUB94517.1 DNA polymerase I [Leptotrichia sp. oral taxon 218]